ncbi:hypothetical protein HN51_024175 [Arachis hypogaea]|uniref:Bet v I/Major latex protein domain-containing protein n=1 Tax=Arachis hypogaea TaxID=3818 RepID=A0A445C4V2_ARAHY|nr:MLP-like protein 43 [Arachis hypogaea]QHO27194.1 MLP-like protein [Arachis hypogaea]RYR45987.1 hypothetical protein Ahy_A07g031759 [Arachis hypogaea]
MVALLSGKISIEVVIQVAASKFFNVLAKQFHNVPNICERIHGSKLHEGDDWHSTDSVKQWTLLIDGKVKTIKERIEAIDEENKSIIYQVFDDDISEHYKVFKFILQVNEKNDECACVKWTIEYEKINENVETPYAYLDFEEKITKDIADHVLKA